MRADRTEWPSDYTNTLGPADVTVLDQPGFGIKLFWNTPKLWQPTFIVNFWRWRFTIGWMIA